MSELSVIKYLKISGPFPALPASLNGKWVTVCVLLCQFLASFCDINNQGAV